MLDEVDAALDATNVVRLLGLLPRLPRLLRPLPAAAPAAAVPTTAPAGAGCHHPPVPFHSSRAAAALSAPALPLFCLQVRVTSRMRLLPLAAAGGVRRG